MWWPTTTRSKLAAAAALAAALFGASFWIWPLPKAFLERDYSVLHLNAEGQLLRISLSPVQQYRIRLPLDAMSADLKNGFVRYEDRYFRWHPGINPAAILRSTVANVRAKRVVMGGSTITMQIAKMMEPKRRTIGAKLWEMFRALQLEAAYSKDELLEIYLNSVPMGGNIQGVGAASYLYFGKSADTLSFGESAMLIALPRSPNLYRPDKAPEQARRQKGKILQLIGPHFGLTPSDVLENTARAVPAARHTNPFLSPHLVVRARSLAGGPVRRYSIDPALQAFAESALRKAVAKLKPQGVHNGAIVIVDNRTMEVRAYVGSPDFADKSHDGEINGANIARSPGSLLKPFLYALAVEQGLITPRSVLFDIERNYDGYVPANFDRMFRGPVSAEEALIGSLNVPAVNLEFELGEKGLLTLLRNTRLERPGLSPRQAGLSLVLGAHPLTLEELVRLYAIFANGGQMRNLAFEKDEGNLNRGIRIFSPATAYILAEMLTKIERPDLPQSWEFTPNRGRIAFKTGTSFGLRDAWCVGFDPHYTVGVWLGNANAKSSTALVGIKAAAPVVVAVFNHLTRFKDVWFARPDSVAGRTVCAVSGEPWSPHCPARATDLHIPGVSQVQPCRLHRPIMVRRADGAEVCRFCMEGARSDYEERVIELWPPDVAAYLRSAGKPSPAAPPHNPNCTAGASDRKLKLRSPLPGGFYAVTAALAEEQQKIPLMVQSQRAGEIVYWYLNDKLIGEGSPDRTLFIRPEPGRHRVTVRDAWGGSDTVVFSVKRGLR